MSTGLKLGVTVGNKPGRTDEQRARTVAARYGLPFVTRGYRRALTPLWSRYDGLFVVADDGVTLWSKAGPFRWSPGMAHLRVQRLDAGHQDNLFLRHAALEPGNTVLDCTLGLAADALVAARAVGAQGRVLGVEKSLPLLVLTTEGLERHDPGPRSCRIQTLHADAGKTLEAQPDKSFDLVVMDPMFERPAKASPNFELLRNYADHAELTLEMVSQARRVARKQVLVKASRYSNDLKKLGLEAERPSPGARVVWARIR